jgi:tRNA nucleotidyltransferase/poly(A) polymerase
MKPVIEAFLNSGDIKVIDDTSKDVTMPKKSLFLCGGAVRDFLKGKSPKELHLCTNATPAQTALILHSAGFRFEGGQIGKLKITFRPRSVKEGAVRTWKVGNADKKENCFSIIATYKDETFEICTLMKDPKTSEITSAKEFVDNPNDDANTRDLTMNALYIELSKSDGENNKLYDPTQKGWHDTTNGVVRTVGSAEDRFKEDPIRMLRAVRFHARFGKGDKLDPDIRKAMERFKTLTGVSLAKVRDEFLKGLLHPDTDVKRYINIYKASGLFEKLFPKVEIHDEIPPDFTSRKDKPLALAWILQDNPLEVVADALAPSRNDEETGWNQQDKRAVLFLLAIKEFTPEARPKAMGAWKGTGLSKSQIKDWVDMFNITDARGVKRNRRPVWALHVRTFADNDLSLAAPKEVEHLPDANQGQALQNLETDKFKKLLPAVSL